MSGKSVAEPTTRIHAANRDFDVISELDMVRDQLAQAQLKLRVALSRYEELYQYSEQTLKESEEKINGFEALVKAKQAEQDRLNAAISELNTVLQSKDGEIQRFRNNANTLARVIGKNLQSLSDVTGFVEDFAEKIDEKGRTTESGSLTSPLISKGARIMLEQLKHEVENLRRLQTQLSG